MTEWQPIETAPKDGAILLWIPCGSSARPVIGRFDENRYAKTPRPYWTSAGEERINGTIWMRANQPTHWMPLPQPPVA